MFHPARLQSGFGIPYQRLSIYPALPRSTAAAARADGVAAVIVFVPSMNLVYYANEAILRLLCCRVADGGKIRKQKPGIVSDAALSPGNAGYMAVIVHLLENMIQKCRQLLT